MLPRPCPRISGATAWLMWKQPRRLVSMTASHSSAVMSASAVPKTRPALFTSTSTRPKASRASATMSRQRAASRTSQPRPRCCSPRLAAASPTPSASMSASATRAPCAANSRAVASPMLRGAAAPVTIAVRPSSSPCIPVSPGGSPAMLTAGEAPFDAPVVPPAADRRRSSPSPRRRHAARDASRRAGLPSRAGGTVASASGWTPGASGLRRNAALRCRGSRDQPVPSLRYMNRVGASRPSGATA